MAELQPIIVFHSRHFVRHLGICKQMCQSSTTDVRCHYAQFSEKNEISILTLWTPGNCLPTLRKLPYAARSLLTDGTVYQRWRQETVDRWHSI